MILDGIYIKIEDSIERARVIKEISGALYKQAGNSMPVPVLEEIFKALLN